LKSTRITSVVASIVFALPIIAEGATYRVTVEGVLTHRSEIVGLPLPFAESTGDQFSFHWDLDDSVVPYTLPGQYVWWDGLVQSIGYATATSAGVYSEYTLGNNAVYIATEPTRSYYNLEASFESGDPSYRYFVHLLLNGPAGMSLDDVGQLDPRPLAQWTEPGPIFNRAGFATCPTTSGGCSGTTGTVTAVHFELLPDVTDPEVLLEELGTIVLGEGPGNSFANKIMLAQTYLAVPDEESACLILGDFLNQVRAQRGKKLTEEQADQFTSDAGAIIAAIGCD
jgi:hypothetical protein